MSIKSGACVLVVVYLLNACSAMPVAAQQPATTAPQASTEPIKKITVDLAARTFDRVLPFDVPFFIVGTAPEGTVKLEVQYRVGSKQNALSGIWLPAEPAAWEPDAPASGKDPFLVFIRDALDAERYFQFRFVFFRRPSEAQATRFRTDARPLFDDHLAVLGARAISEADAIQIRQDLADIVKSVAGSAQWQTSPGSAFDTSAATAKGIFDFLQKHAVPVLSPQVTIAAVLPNFSTSRLSLRLNLGTIQADADLDAAIAAAQKLNNAALNELLRLDADGLSLSSMSVAEMDLASAGGVMGDLREARRPEDPVARATNYASLVTRLQKLDHFLHAVSDTQGAARPLVAPAITPAAVARLAALAAPAGAVTASLEQAQSQVANTGQIAAALRDRDAALAALTENIVLLLRAERFIEGTTVADGATTQNNYISADGGLLYAGDIGHAALFVGSNIYLRPVNKDAPLSLKGSFSRRFAFTVGVTLSTIADENSRTRSDLFANSSLVLGAGIRITQSIRIGGGALIFKESDPNPLVTKKTAAATWYASFSFDINVAKGLQGLGGEFK
jgi:hypothetical protein